MIHAVVMMTLQRQSPVSSDNKPGIADVEFLDGSRERGVVPIKMLALATIRVSSALLTS